MDEVFITDDQHETQAECLSSIIENENAGLQIHVDLNETDLSFPCGHTILRLEGDTIDAAKIMATVRSQGFQCEVLEDKICTPTRRYD